MAQYGISNSDDSKERVTNPLFYGNLVGSKAVFIAAWGLAAVISMVVGVPLAVLIFSGLCVLSFFAATIKQLELITDALKTANKLAASGLSN